MNPNQGKVLFLTVFSGAEDPALAHALALARGSGSSLLIAEVKTKRAAMPALDDVSQLVDTSTVATEVRRIRPDEVAALASADDIAMILLGSHGRDGLRDLLQIVPNAREAHSTEDTDEPEQAAGGHSGSHLRERLTPREIEVLVYLAQGLSVKECARVMRRSPSTIDNHKTRLMRKLSLHRVVDLARFAVREGLISK